MKKLFIIGNGFDLFHGLPTRYTDFMDFMKQHHPEVVEGYIEGIRLYSLLYWNKVDHIKEEILWNDMENIFGSYEMMEMMEEHRDWNSPYDYRGEADKRLLRILDMPLHINAYLQEWLEDIAPHIKHLQPNRKLNRLLSGPANLAVNFNYTTVLEDVYHIPDVVHIHGKKGGRLIMGHGEKLGRYYFDDTEYGINAVNEKYVITYYRNSYKNCAKIMKGFPELFEGDLLNSVSEVYIMGHSLNAIDMPYIRRIRRKLPNETRWFVFTLHGEEQYKDIMRSVPVAKKNLTYLRWEDYRE
ncbi:AbiH family protein [Anaerolentibacter hominis]|uniref:AbiH family protein n=1 Tax=Anaerolentibacter hominis TaxID=3079009 RepID=UPI0031B88568